MTKTILNWTTALCFMLATTAILYHFPIPGELISQAVEHVALAIGTIVLIIAGSVTATILLLKLIGEA